MTHQVPASARMKSIANISSVYSGFSHMFDAARVCRLVPVLPGSVDFHFRGAPPGERLQPVAGVSRTIKGSLIALQGQGAPRRQNLFCFYLGNSPGNFGLGNCLGNTLPGPGISGCRKENREREPRAMRAKAPRRNAPWPRMICPCSTEPHNATFARCWASGCAHITVTPRKRRCPNRWRNSSRSLKRDWKPSPTPDQARHALGQAAGLRGP